MNKKSIITKLNKATDNLLIITNANGLGDFIRILYFVFHIKYYHKLSIDITCFSKIDYNKNFTDLFKDQIFITSDETLLKNNYSLVIYDQGEKPKKFRNYKNILNLKLYPNYLDLDITKLRKLIHIKIKDILKLKKKNNNNNIVIGIGTISRKNKGFSDNDFQDLISQLIIKNENINFELIGLSKEIVNNKLINILLKKNVTNSLDLDIYDSINIINNNKIYLGKSSGFLHIAGLLDLKTIYIDECNNKYERFLSFFGIPFKIERNNEIFIKYKFTPLSNELVRISSLEKNLLQILSNEIKNIRTIKTNYTFIYKYLFYFTMCLLFFFYLPICFKSYIIY